MLVDAPLPAMLVDAPLPVMLVDGPLPAMLADVPLPAMLVDVPLPNMLVDVPCLKPDGAGAARRPIFINSIILLKSHHPQSRCPGHYKQHNIMQCLLLLPSLSCLLMFPSPASLLVHPTTTNILTTTSIATTSYNKPKH